MSSRKSSRPSVFPGFADLATDQHELLRQLVARRVELALSQTEVAARMATSQSAIARLEGGSLNPRVETLRRYAEAVQVDLHFGLRPRTGGTP